MKKKWFRKFIRWLENKFPFDETAGQDAQTEVLEEPEDESVSYGVRDMLFCRMPVEKQDLGSIASGHEIRPYLVMKTGEHGFWGYPMTTTHERYDFDEKMVYKEVTIANGEQKDSYFLFVPSVYVPDENILSFYGHLERRWEKPIDKRIACQKRQHMYCQYLSFQTKIEMERGDIVQLKNGMLAFYNHALPQNKSELLPLLDKKPYGSAIDVLVHKRICWIDKGKPMVVDDQDLWLYSLMPHSRVEKLLMAIDMPSARPAKRPDCTPRTPKLSKPARIVPAEEIYYLYEPGTVLEDSFSHEQFIYFFSCRSAHYIFPDELHMRGKYRLSEVRDLPYKPVAFATENEMKRCFEHFQSGSASYTFAMRKVKEDYEMHYASLVYDVADQEPVSPLSKPKIGMKVAHRQFGEGVIEKIDGSKTTVLFSGGTKVLNWDFLTRNGKIYTLDA